MLRKIFVASVFLSIGSNAAAPTAEVEGKPKPKDNPSELLNKVASECKKLHDVEINLQHLNNDEDKAAKAQKKAEDEAKIADLNKLELSTISKEQCDKIKDAIAPGMPQDQGTPEDDGTEPEPKGAGIAAQPTTPDEVADATKAQVDPPQVDPPAVPVLPRESTETPAPKETPAVPTDPSAGPTVPTPKPEQNAVLLKALVTQLKKKCEELKIKDVDALDTAKVESDEAEVKKIFKGLEEKKIIENSAVNEDTITEEQCKEAVGIFSKSDDCCSTFLMISLIVIVLAIGVVVVLMMCYKGDGGNDPDDEDSTEENA